MADPELKWWHVRWGLFGRGFKKIGLWLAIALAAIATLLVAGRFVYGFFAPWYLVQDQSKEAAAWVVPTPLPDQSVTQLSGTRVEAYGYSIQTPWSEQPEIKPHKTITVVAFRQSNAGLLLFDPDEGTTENLPVKMRSDPDVKKLFSEQDRGSFYQLISDEIAARPDNARWWTPRRYRHIHFSAWFLAVEVEACRQADMN